MKKLLLLLLMSVAGTAWAAPNPAEYTIDVHVVSSRVETQWTDKSRTTSRILNVVIDGRKYELTHSGENSPRLIAPGDYKARIVSDESTPKHVLGRPEKNVIPKSTDNPHSSYLIGLKYELLYPDQKTEKFAVTGVTE